MNYINELLVYLEDSSINKKSIDEKNDFLAGMFKGYKLLKEKASSFFDLAKAVRKLELNNEDKENVVFRKHFTHRQAWAMYYILRDFGKILSTAQLSELSEQKTPTKMTALRKIMIPKTNRLSSDEEVVHQHKLGEQNGLTYEEISLYANAKFTKEYMAMLRKLITNKTITEKEVREHLLEGIDESLQKEICLIKHMPWIDFKDVLNLIDPKMVGAQLKQIRLGVKHGLNIEQISTYANVENTVNEMSEIRTSFMFIYKEERIGDTQFKPLDVVVLLRDFKHIHHNCIKGSICSVVRIDGDDSAYVDFTDNSGSIIRAVNIDFKDLRFATKDEVNIVREKRREVYEAS